MNQSDQINEYTREVRVASYEVGAQRLLKLSVLMRMCQETSEQHVDLVGLSYEKMYEDGIVFLLITNQAKIKRMPVHNEKITIKTHPRGVSGAQFYRDFVFYSGAEQIIEVMQTSIIADSNTHKVMRPKKFLDYGVFSGVKVEPENRIAKVVVPEDLPLVGERPIRYSDLDYNCHLNNTIYGDILTDFLPGGAEGNRYAQAQINYVNESTRGEVLKIYAEQKNGKVLMQGVNSRGCGFTASATLLPIDGKA
nr:acyl-ACP thioesterase domain-containing protein [uncultured Caproiciproducens sp.]